MEKSHGFLWADVGGLSLTAEDREVLAHPTISGVILFARNYESPLQLKKLTAEIKAVSSDLIITVDQEGGRVQRFRTGFTELPSMEHWGLLYQENPDKMRHEFSTVLDTMISELKNNGVYSSLVPVMDINYGRNQVIGHRSFGNNADIVIALTDFFIQECHRLKMPVTGKHFPGHGYVEYDSHFVLPIDKRSFSEIEKTDLKPFAQLASKLDAIMLAHVVYTEVDKNPVCFSHKWIKTILRDQLHFDGIVMCDDLCMKAVSNMGSADERAQNALDAGCDVILVCNNRPEVVTILDKVHLKRDLTRSDRLRRYERFLSVLS